MSGSGPGHRSRYPGTGSGGLGDPAGSAVSSPVCLRPTRTRGWMFPVCQARADAPDPFFFLVILLNFSLVNHWRAVTSPGHPARGCHQPLTARAPAASAGLAGLLPVLEVRGCAGGALFSLSEVAAVSSSVLGLCDVQHSRTAERSDFAAPHRFLTSGALPSHARRACAPIPLWMGFMALLSVGEIVLG